MPVRRRHHGRQQIERSVPEPPQGLGPRQVRGDLETHAEDLFQALQIGRGDPQRRAGPIDELHRRPMGVDADPQDRVLGEPGP
ncbi:hypothetical protein RZS08_19125, partial [Arthrospira platensis SPKY1]|nr:hypothetical protein [Arthrospira platensis SPKY1]